MLIVLGYHAIAKKFLPFGSKVLTHWLVAFFYNRIRVERVGMVQGLVLQARRAFATRVAVVTIGTVNILSCGKCEGKFWHPRLAVKQKSVGYIVTIDHVPHLFYCFLVSYDVAEFHLLI